MRNSNILRAFIIVIVWIAIGKTHAQTIDESLELMVSVAKQELNAPPPSQFDPLALNAKLVWSENREQVAVVMKVSLLTDWHVYAAVSRKSPFIATKVKLILPDEGFTPLGEWEEPIAESYDEEASVYKGEELFFVRYFEVDKDSKADDKLKCGLYYQACDPNKCFPPKTKMVDLIK